ncbi:MAG: flagellar hook capping FlgD N-terminal domain-containing protein [Ignavibacteriales bacterium]
MAVSTVTNNTAATTSTTSTTSATSSTSTRNTGELGKDQFLQLLVTQLKYQNPLEPMDDKEFISQMAQFSSLEQMQNLNTNFSSMKAFSLMGKSVTATMSDSTTGETTTITGTVNKVRIENGKTYVEIDGKEVSIDNITDVNNGTSTRLTDLMDLIGKSVNASVSDGKNNVSVSGIVSEVKKVSGKDCAELDNVELLDVDVVMPDYVTDYKIDYLEDNIGKEVTVKVKDSKGNEVKVTGTLADVVQKDGKIHVLLDGVTVPINDISGIE